MGCNSSKLDGLPAVTLCRDRCNFLEEALCHSYALADAHAAYLQSLKTVGDALHGFLHQVVDYPSDNDASGGEEPPDKCSPASSSPLHSVSSSDWDSRPKFDSDSDEEERLRDRELLLNFPKQEAIISDHDPFMPMDCIKNQPAQSIFFSNYRSNSHRNFESGTRTPPPPPPAPSGSAWDFINFFESYEHFPYTVIGKDVKDEVAASDQEGRSMKKIHKKESISRNQGNMRAEEEQTNQKVSAKNNWEAKTKNEPEKNKDGSKNSASGEPMTENSKSHDPKVTKELQEFFKTASEAGNEVSKMFDTAKFRCHYKNSVHHISSNILYMASPSFFGLSSLFSSKMNSHDPYSSDEFGVNINNLSSTLKKLCIWERKLYQEVKAEEKLRTAHVKNYKQLRRFQQKGPDYVHKVEPTRALLRSLSTRMRVSIHMIDKICVMTNKLRDEELWPQMKDLIHRLSIMWICMLESHRSQSTIISEAKKLDAITLKGNLDMAQLELAMELNAELRNWSLSLSNWIESQKQFIKSLNGWLMRCLRQDPQEPTPDFIDTPPVFGITHQWSQALQRSTEKEVSEAVYAFLMHINRQMEKQKVEMQQRNVISDDKDIERKLMIFEKEEQKMNKYFVQSWERKMNMTSVESIANSSLKSNLEQIFMSMERLATGSKQAYEELDLKCT